MLPFFNLELYDRRQHDLRDAHAALDVEVVISKIDQDYFYLTPVVGINGPRRVEAGNSVLEGKAGPRPHLRFIALRDLEDEAGVVIERPAEGKRRGGVPT